MFQRLSIFLMLFCLVGRAVASERLAEADSLYALRGAVFDEETLLADSSYIDQAMSLYQEAIENDTGAVREEATWKLLRAYYFKGNYTSEERDFRRAIFNEGKETGVVAAEEFPESAGVNLWLAALYGMWAEEYGKMKAAQEGAAGKMRKLCRKVIELDSTFNDAGGYRVLGRLHFKSPKIPLILGWPSKKKAVMYLEKAIEIVPDNLYTKLYLAEALYKRKQREKAIDLMTDILSTEETVIGVVEDAHIKREAMEILTRWNEGEDEEE